MSAVIHPPGGVYDAGHDNAPRGWRRWVYATNHKDIGTLYLLFSFTMFIVGGVLALLIRAELFRPGLQIMNPELLNQFVTMHGLIMIFGPGPAAHRTGTGPAKTLTGTTGLPVARPITEERWQWLAANWQSLSGRNRLNTGRSLARMSLSARLLNVHSAPATLARELVSLSLKLWQRAT